MIVPIKANSPRAWLLAARPKTLTGAITPVVLALALAAPAQHGRLSILPAALCLLFAIIMQIDANFINDYFDWRKGNDNPATRLGPERACTMGWVTPKAMQRAILLTTLVACAIGLPLIYFGGWAMLLVGLACVVFCFLYTTALAARGLGDVLVVLFFGLVPVCCTYFLQTGEVNKWIVALALTCGFVIDNLLIVNNFRDIDNDRRDGKTTLVVLVGKKFSLVLYFFIGCAATFVIFIYTHFDYRGCIMLVYLFLHCRAYSQMQHLSGKELNAVLASTARNNLIFGVSAAVVALLRFVRLLGDGRF